MKGEGGEGGAGGEVQQLEGSHDSSVSCSHSARAAVWKKDAILVNIISHQLYLICCVILVLFLPKSLATNGVLQKQRYERKGLVTIRLLVS